MPGYAGQLRCPPPEGGKRREAGLEPWPDRIASYRLLHDDWTEMKEASCDSISRSAMSLLLR